MSVNFTPVRITNGQMFTSEEFEPINVSNSNAADILANLGLDPKPDEFKPMNLEAFEAECATFLRIARRADVDAGVAPVTKANWTDCGRREGYLTDRITRLHNLARAALAAGATHMSVG